MATYLRLEEKDKKSLECPICKDWLKIPKVTKCNHVFCLNCLTSYIDNHEENCPPCPVCRQRIVVPQKGINAFKTESFYEDLIDRMTKDDDLNAITKLGVCGVCNKVSELETKCFSCAFLICKACTHAHNVLKPNCSVITLSDIHNHDEDELMSRRIVTCEKHPDEAIKLYCLKCNAPVCTICMLTKHSLHKCENIESHAKYCRNWLKDIQPKLDKMIEESSNIKSNIAEKLNDFLTENQNIEQRVNRSFDRLIAQLYEKRNNFLTGLRDKTSDVKSRMHRQIDKAEQINLEGTALREIAKKTFNFGVDVDATVIKFDLEKQFENLRRQLYSTLHKDFKINVHFQKSTTIDIKEAIDMYNVGVVEYSQQLAMKSCTNTTLSPDISRVAGISMASDADRLFLAFQEHQAWLRWRVGEMVCVDKAGKQSSNGNHDDYIFTPQASLYTTVSSTSNGKIVVFHPFSGLLTNIDDEEQMQLNIKKDAFPYHYFYNLLALPESGGYLMNEARDQCIHRLSPSGEVTHVIDNKYTKGVQTSMTTDRNNDILLVGQLKDGRGHCTVLDLDGNLKFRKIYDETYGQLPIQNSYGCFDNIGNILMRVESLKTRDRQLLLLSPEEMNEEKLCLPPLSNGEIPIISGVCHRCDALLYLTVNKGSKILTVSYLP